MVIGSRLTSVKQLDFNSKHDVFPSPTDWRDVFLYQALLDRFDDNKDHPPYDPKTARRGRDESQSFLFQGGNLKGVTRRLEYIKGLGCNAIWITPPFKQVPDDLGSYHGYGIQDFLAIDPRFGTTQDLKDLVREAHSRGIYVVLDIVINHTGNVFDYVEKDVPYRKDGAYTFKDWHRVKSKPDEPLSADDGVWPVELQDVECFKRKGSIRDFSKADLDEVVNGDFFALKELVTTNPKVMDTLIKCYKYWIAECDVDGYRIDTVRHVEPESCAIFCNAIREYATRIGKHNFILFGEIIAGDDELQRYVGGNIPAPGTQQWYPRLDAVLDYPLYNVLDEVIKGISPCGQLRDRYEQFRKFYRAFAEAGQYYVTFIDNHDQPTRPYRRFLNAHTDDWKLGALGIGYLLCNLGIPCMYYGTEQGFDGGGDKDTCVRECMFGGTWGGFDTTGVQFFNPDHPIYKQIAKICQVRATHAALRYGRQYFRDISGDGEHFGCPVDGKCTLAFSRILDTQEIVCIFNLDTQLRNDWVHVGKNQLGPGCKLIDAVADDGQTFDVEPGSEGSAIVRVPLGPRQMRILKLAPLGV